MKIFRILNIMKKAKAFVYWKLPCLSPVDSKKIVCVSYYGRNYSDNPSAITDEIIDRKLNYRVIWLVNNLGSGDFPDDVEVVRMDSLKGVYHMRTAGVWIDNCRKMSYVRKRKSQFYIQTWHGVALKQIEKDAVSNLSERYVKMAVNDSSMCDLLLSGCEMSTDLYRSSFWYGGEILKCGSPRNDIFFDKDRQKEITRKTKNKLGLSQDVSLVLYAPTFRRDKSMAAYDLDYGRLCDSLEKKFKGRWTALLRLHPNIAEQSCKLVSGDKNVVDVSLYSNMQDLLISSDVLITDYSSSFFDFMLTGRPCFLYANDIDQYKEDRGFYIKLDDLPFPLASTKNELDAAIKEYDTLEQKRSLDGFIRSMGFYDDGHASSRVVDRIEKNNKRGL